MTREGCHPEVSIGARCLGVGSPTLVIAEVAQAHDGSLGTAHAFVDAIADAGADAVKFQTHIAHAESTPAEPFRVPFSLQDVSRYAYWERTAFTEEQWRELAEHARERALLFLSSPFSLEAVELLERIGVPAWKIGSGEVGNSELLARVAATGLPILVSSGMSALNELDRTVSQVRDVGSPVVVLQCTSEYPCPPERTGLNLIAVFRERYACPVGLSDHSGTIYPSLAAVALGASVIEVHVTLSREMFGPDVQASVTTHELCQLCDGVRFLDRALTEPVDKDALARDFEPLREIFTKSVVVRTDLPAGTILQQGHLTLKKPGTGLPAERIPTLVGRRLKRSVRSDELLQEDDLE
ncbi:MAG: N-acetylneuraminate synthase family protein [Chloroflexi bacterium]|nr:N-acetylneuraminate synthase family protein [Chloroflexota bacterium]